MPSRIPLISALGLLLVVSGCSDSDGVQPGQDTEAPVAEVQRKDSASGGSSPDLALRDRLENFERSAEQLGERLDDGARPPELEQQSRQLANQAMPILDAYAKQNPDCTNYLSESRAVMGRLSDMSLGELRRNFADDEALSEAPAKCRRVQKLLLHPAALVVRLQSSSDRATLVSEHAALMKAIRKVKSGV